MSFWENIFFLLQHPLITFAPAFWFLSQGGKWKWHPQDDIKATSYFKMLFAKIIYKILFVTVIFL